MQPVRPRQVWLQGGGVQRMSWQPGDPPLGPRAGASGHGAGPSLHPLRPGSEQRGARPVADVQVPEDLPEAGHQADPGAYDSINLPGAVAPAGTEFLRHSRHDVPERVQHLHRCRLPGGAAEAERNARDGVPMVRARGRVCCHLPRDTPLARRGGRREALPAPTAAGAVARRAGSDRHVALGRRARGRLHLRPLLRLPPGVGGHGPGLYAVAQRPDGSGCLSAPRLRGQ
mmetsp:Transcript_85752/g.265438  ORF Transcript_85752/g.265438 Transcript_85752/m.265438 type:complete len:229 (+) Transcript_85752:821-1507(+)